MEQVVSLKAFKDLEATVAALINKSDVWESKYKSLHDKYNALVSEYNNLQEVLKSHQGYEAHNSSTSTEEDMEDVDIATPANHVQTKINENMKSINNKENNKPAGNLTTAAKRVAPVIKCYNINIKMLTNDMKKILGHTNFSLKIINKNITNVIVFCYQDHCKVVNHLNKLQYKYYTYTPVEAKPYSIDVEGLSSTYDTEEVLQYLMNVSNEFQISKVIKLKGDKWLVQLDRTSNIREFFKIKYILNCKISLRKHKQRGPIQCRNCQRFGHISSNCKMPYRCVKCSGDHGPGKCKIPPKHENKAETFITDAVTGEVRKQVGLPIKCANCNAEGHVASDKNCPRRAQILKKMQDRNKPRNAYQVSNSLSFADCVKSTKNVAHHQLNHGNVEIKHLDNECKRLLGKDIQTCLVKIGQFATQYNKLKDDGERTRSLFELLLSIRLYD